MSPQARDQSKRVPLKEASIWSLELSKSSKVLWFRSFQIHLRMHNGTKFQIWDECFPSQFHQPKSKSGIELDITQDKPKVIKTKLHNRCAISQWRSKWSTVSPLWRQLLIPSHENSYKISSSKIYYSHSLDDTINQICKLPCHLNTHITEDRAF